MAMPVLKLTQGHLPPETLSTVPGGSSLGPGHPWTPSVLSALRTPERVQHYRLPIASVLAHYL